MARSAAEQTNHDLVMRLFAEVLNPLDPAAVDRFVAADYIQHSRLAAPGRDGLKAFLTWARQTNPGAVHDIKRSFADGDHVVVHHHVRRWPDDPGLAVIDIFRLADGLVVEHWDVLQELAGDSPNPAPVF